MATTDFTNGVTLSDAGWADDIDCAGYAMLTGVGGTANAITATGPATYSLSATRPPVWFIAGSTNTGATTITITPSGSSALTTKNVFSGGAACVGGEFVAGGLYGLAYDGTQFQIVNGAKSSTFTGTLTGCTTSPTVTFAYTKDGSSVNFKMSGGFSATSNADTKTITGMPAEIRPASTCTFPVFVSDNGGTQVVGYCTLATNGTFTLYPTAAVGLWTASGTTTVQPFNGAYTTA